LNWKEGKDVHVLKYIKKEAVRHIFSVQEEKIKRYVEEGYKYENACDLSGALRNYYWSLMLLRVHPYANQLVWNDYHLESWLPNHIEEILGLANFSIEGIRPIKRKSEFMVAVSYGSDCYPNLSVKAFDAKEYPNWKGPIKIDKGRAVITKKGEVSASSTLDLKIEYEFRDLGIADNDVNSVLSSLEPIKFSNEKSIPFVYSRDNTDIGKTVGSNKAKVIKVVSKKEVKAWSRWGDPLALGPDDEYVPTTIEYITGKDLTGVNIVVGYRFNSYISAGLSLEVLDYKNKTEEEAQPGDKFGNGLGLGMGINVTYYPIPWYVSPYISLTGGLLNNNYKQKPNPSDYPGYKPSKEDKDVLGLFGQASAGLSISTGNFLNKIWIGNLVFHGGAGFNSIKGGVAYRFGLTFNWITKKDRR
jgi:hypothetical protein